MARELTRLDEARQTVAEHSRRLVADRLVAGTAGNLSVRVGDLLAVTPSGVAYDTLTGDDVCVVDLDGSVVDGTLKPTSELPLHLLCYARHDAGAVVHTHSGAAVALSLLRDDVPLVHYQTAIFGGTVAVAEYAPFGTDELAANVSAALAGRTAAVMRHHGTVVLAGSLRAAYDGAAHLEWLCEVWLRAAAVGSPRLLSTEQVDDVAERLRDYGQR
ncbi:class II aldolase/adducin family protein [Actinomycetospora endophytica]|uniref:Class II aldolase/adducin family protein n=1 Tax=Actinomycetospora endophytica TaxID=2291215 RepID=A0ABS8PDD3_9PSEU|nr:class II aldolase/adducin family protein [Actinomycetospora endophytica]MCD2196290.1 class II aldolase/adducin family protein [Actinomycetospora endophytica]